MGKLRAFMAVLFLAVVVYLIVINFQDQGTVITRENFNQVNKTQIEKMGDELVDETRMQHQKIVPEIIIDETVYDDIEKVKVEVVPVTELNPEITN